MFDPLPKHKFPELFFGLVAPIGSIFNPTENALKKKLQEFGYHVIDIRITDLFPVFSKQIIPTTSLDETSRFKRYISYINYGNQIRQATKNKSIMAVMAMYLISLERQKHLSRSKKISQPPTKIAYLIRQFKRPEEIELLRSLYGDQFFQVSIYSTRSSRVSNLAELFSKECNEVTSDAQRANAENIVQRDQSEDKDKDGQRVRKTFHEADFIVNGDEKNTEIKKKVFRFVELLFGSNTISPYRDEYGMKLANSAALRSIDLSRQVGAAIFDKTGQIVSLGSNEVPKGKGGTYWADDEMDAREYTKPLPTGVGRIMCL